MAGTVLRALYIKSHLTLQWNVIFAGKEIESQ